MNKFRLYNSECNTFSYFDICSTIEQIPANCKNNISIFTGRQDINGQDIYEHDLVKFSFKGIPKSNILVVTWYGLYLSWGLGTKGRIFLWEIDNLEVIGNIFQKC